MRIAILVPFYKTMPAATCKCLLDLATQLGKFDIESEFISVSNTYLHDARETLFERLEKAHKKKSFNWVLHIDSDQTFATKQVVALLKHAEEKDFPILSGIYFSSKTGGIMPVLMRKFNDERRRKMADFRKCKVSEIKGDYYRIANVPKEAFFEIDVIGFGFFVCKPKVYADIKAKFGRPIFAPEMDKSLNRIRGEDAVWCNRAQECGYKIMVDRSIMVGHMGGDVGFREHKGWLLEKLEESQRKKLQK